jgi:hypothetical protein
VSSIQRKEPEETVADKIVVLSHGPARVLVEENTEPGKVGLHLAHPAQVEPADMDEKVAVLKKAGWEVIAVAERLAKDSDGGDPYLALAKEVRDKLQAMVDEADQGADLGCLINCTDRTKDETMFGWLSDALSSLTTAAHLLQCVVDRIEKQAKAGGQT